VAHTYPKDGTVVVQLVVVDRQGAASPPAVQPVKLTDGAPPTVRISKPKANQTVSLTTKRTKTVTKDGKQRRVTTTKRTRLGFAGTARDPSGVSAVFLTLERLSIAKQKATKKTNAKSAAAKTKKKKKQCVWLDPKLGFVTRACDKPVLIRTGVRSGNWAYNLASAIKPRAGSYRVSAYGTDNAGAFGNSAPTRARVVRFTLTD
jgi:hypothetical protein